MGEKSFVSASKLRRIWRHLAVRMAVGAAILGALMALVASIALAVTPSFSDVPVEHPYRAAIQDLASRGVVSGYVGGTFRPDNPVIRQQFAKMIVLALGYSVPAGITCPFSDVDLTPDPLDPNYPAKYVAVCAFHGITAGETPTTFAPYEQISRQQLITMVARAAGLTAPPGTYVPPFSPGQFTLDEHYQNARKAAYAGLLDGLQGIAGGYSFASSASRGECAQLLHNLIATVAPGTTDTTTGTAGAPTITGVSPNLGPVAGGISVTISGTNFVGLSGDGAVKFGSLNALGYTVNSPTSITATVPAGAAGTVQVQVTAAGGTTANTAADDYTYVAAPDLTDLSPSQGPPAGGNSIVITGTNFIGLSGPGAVKFGSTNATSYTVDSPTSITAVVPPGTAGLAGVAVIAVGGDSGWLGWVFYDYVPTPTVTSLSPDSGPEAGGNSIVITGTNFIGLSGPEAVKFGSTNAASYTVAFETQMTAVAPPGTAGTVDVTVTAVGGTSTTAGVGNDYTYVAPPTVTGLSPNSGPEAGGTSVTITGTNFVGLSGPEAVQFNGYNATSYTVYSNTQIVAVAPPGSVGAVDVVVTTAGGVSVTAGLGNDYTYVAAGPAPTGYENLGGLLTSGPAVCSWGPGRLDVFSRGPDNALWHKSYSGGIWSEWESLGGVLTSDPAAVSWGPDRIDVFARGLDNAMWRKVWDGVVWKAWERVDGALDSGPAAASEFTGVVTVYARRGDGALMSNYVTGGTWATWENLGGVLTSDPAAVSWGVNRYDIFARGLDNALWHKRYDGSGYSTWESLGGALSSGPGVSSWGLGRLDVFARGPGNTLWTKSFLTDTWSGWMDLGGATVTSDPDAVSWGPDRIDVFVRGADGALWHKWWDGEAWHPDS